MLLLDAQGGRVWVNRLDGDNSLRQSVGKWIRTMMPQLLSFSFFDMAEIQES